MIKWNNWFRTNYLSGLIIGLETFSHIIASINLCNRHANNYNLWKQYVIYYTS
jgi:hypothetical protein